MTQFLGFARNYGGDFFVMTWVTGRDAKKFDVWQDNDNSEESNITLLNIPAVVTTGMSPYTASVGKWMYVTVHLNRTTTVRTWSDVLKKMVKCPPQVVRTIRVTVNNDSLYTPMFFSRNGNLWLSDPHPSYETPREDTMILNMVRVAGQDAFPESIQTKLTSYFPSSQRQHAIKADVPTRLPFKSMEAEDVQSLRPVNKPNKLPNIKRTRNVTPWPERKDVQPHGLGKYSIVIPVSVKEVLKPRPQTLSWFSQGEERVKVVSHVRPDPFSRPGPQDKEEPMMIEDTNVDTQEARSAKPDTSFDNYQATIPIPQDIPMDVDKNQGSDKLPSFSSSKSDSVSDTFTPSPDDAKALPALLKPMRALSEPAKVSHVSKIPPAFPINLTLLQVIPEAQSTPNTSNDDNGSSSSKPSAASTIPLPSISPEPRFSPPRRPVEDTVPTSSTPTVTPNLLGLQPSLARFFKTKDTPPLSPESYRRATLPIPGALGPDLLTPSTSQEYSSEVVRESSKEDSDSSTRNNPPSKIRFVPINIDLFTSEVICPDSPTHDPDSPTYVEEIVIEDFDPRKAYEEAPEDTPEEEIVIEEEEKKEVPHK